MLGNIVRATGSNARARQKHFTSHPTPAMPEFRVYRRRAMNQRTAPVLPTAQPNTASAFFRHLFIYELFCRRGRQTEYETSDLCLGRIENPVILTVNIYSN
jgi:hypothetical protein